MRRLLGELVGLAADVAGDVVDVAAANLLAVVDETATWWLLERRPLPRPLAVQLLEKVGAELGARVEYSE